jgi:hypothetical protein
LLTAAKGPRHKERGGATKATPKRCSDGQGGVFCRPGAFVGIRAALLVGW